MIADNSSKINCDLGSVTASMLTLRFDTTAYHFSEKKHQRQNFMLKKRGIQTASVSSVSVLYINVIMSKKKWDVHY